MFQSAKAYNKAKYIKAWYSYHSQCNIQIKILIQFHIKKKYLTIARMVFSLKWNKKNNHWELNSLEVV